MLIGGACKAFLAAMLTVRILQAQEAATKKQTMLIDTSGMTTGAFNEIPAKARAMEEAKSCGRTTREEGKSFNLEELAGAKVKQIRVVKAESYQGQPAPKPEEIRVIVERVWSKRFGFARCQIEWDELVVWWIQAELVFEDGKIGVLITDGRRHVVLQDHDGHIWFAV